MNRSAELVVLVPVSLVTVMSATTAACAGEVAVICVSETMVKLAALVEAKLTPVVAMASAKPVPVMVTSVPPAIGPATGLTPVTVGVAS